MSREATMYAVIKTGGKQQKVQVGDVIEVEKIVTEGDTVTFHPILVVDDAGKVHAGKEAERAVVTAKPMGEKKGEKVKVFKYRPKTGYAKRAGHRQLRTVLEVAEVKLGTARKAPAKAKAKAAPEAAEAAAAAGDEAAAE
jgi:large subunit ribosomal protein L21